MTRIKATIGTDGTTSFEEENSRRQLADEKPYFFRHEDGGLGAVDSIPCDHKTKSLVKDEDIVELYFENLSPEEIADRLKRPIRRVFKALAKFGILADCATKRQFSKSDLPYGWRVQSGRLSSDDGEQWVLQKIAFELKSGSSPEEIIRLFKQIGLKPRRGAWHAEKISRDQKLNSRLLSAWSKNQSGWKDLAVPEATYSDSDAR